MSAAIALDDLKKSYGSTQALSGVSLSVAEGTVHALLGENGAGKSTLVKILSGLVRPDSGRISLFGQEVKFDGPDSASALGIETAFQEVPLIPDLTVTDNLLMPRQPRKWGVLLDRRAARAQIAALQSELHIDDIDPAALARELSLSQRQKVEIARAISRKPRLLILDEPTAALSKADVDWLGARIAELKRRGTTVILVTHRMAEVHEFCTAMSILRNGGHVGTFTVGELPDDKVFGLIMGRSVDASFPPRPANTAMTDTAPLIEARDLSVGHQLQGVTLSVRPGEIVGVAALQGMGQLELFNALFGAERPTAGEIVVGGSQAHFRSPADAIAAGIALVPEDRKIQGLALHRSGVENAVTPVLTRFARSGLLDRTREAREVDAVFSAVNLHPRALYQTPAEFSGGNQQKIVLAKWLLTQCHTLLVFDPTRGVDVGTKHEIYALLRRFADAGGGVLFHSTELPELIGTCDRTLVLYRGRIAADVSHANSDEAGIGALMLGAERAA
ncbi:sugar ABC transporter ATP-binding protein [Dongia sp.]|uniref:sugar ABC transporter ATP-binding protein n=1 Tax=Dongia sp. TaxID=1977262 RepID=UPI0035AF9121